MSALSDLSADEKAELVCSLSALLCGDCGVEINIENMNKVIIASGNNIKDKYWLSEFTSVINKAGGIDKFCKPFCGGNINTSHVPSTVPPTVRELQDGDDWRDDPAYEPSMDLFGENSEHTNTGDY